mmetsp:Transcript_20318/g.57216  ORF Transcript_20318/g.57216 Transcript_20318/m.57216 type:complete len:216 (-) Transcript_20318:256-903(-)
MGHANDHVLAPVLRRLVDHGFETRDQRLAPLQPEALGAAVLGFQELLEHFTPRQSVIDHQGLLLVRHGRRLLEAVAQELQHLRILEVRKLQADRAAVRLPQRRHRLPQRDVLLPRQRPDRRIIANIDGSVQISLRVPVVLGHELGCLGEPPPLQRVQLRLLVPVALECRRYLAQRQGITDRLNVRYAWLGGGRAPRLATQGRGEHVGLVRGEAAL